MNKEDIIALINHNNPPELIARNIIELFEQNKEEFLSIKFHRNQTIFHILALNKKTQVIEHLLQHEELINICELPDKAGQNFLHYLAKISDLDPGYLETICRCLSHLLNSQDNRGNTTLHIGVINENMVWIQTLMKQPGVNRILANSAQKTPYDLTTNKVIHSLLMSIDFSQIKLTEQPDDDLRTSQRKELSDTFPLLSSNDRSALASSSSPVLSYSSGSLTSSSSQSSCDSSSPRQDINSRKKLIDLLSNDPFEDSVLEYNLLLQTFCSHCIYADIGTDEDLNALLTGSRKHIRLLNDAQTTLSPILQAREHTFQQEKKLLLNSFIETLSFGGLIAALPSLDTPDFSHIDETRQRVLSFSLWLICAGQYTPDSARSLDLIQLRQCAIGLHNSEPLHEVFLHLCRLFPSFDHHQKLFANYLIWQLVSRNLPSFSEPTNPIALQWDVFKQINASKDSGLAKLGHQLNEALDTLIASRTRIFHSQLFHNQQTLIRLSSHSIFQQEKMSFGQLVQDAISGSSSDQPRLISLIARELKIHSKSWYQKLSYHPFYSEEGKKVMAEHARYFDQLFDLFSNKILKQSDPLKRQKAMIFLLRLAQELYASDGELHRDLNHFKLVFQVINSPPISRLKHLFSAWTPREHLIREEMSRFFSERNEKWLRLTSRVEAESLPPLCNVGKDYEYARQNETPVYRLEMCGKALEPLEQSAQLVRFDSGVYHSDLPGYFDRYSMLSAEERDARSCRIQPREKMDVLKLSEHPEHIARDMSETITELRDNILSRGIIPGVAWGQTEWPAADIIHALMTWGQTRLSSLEKAQIPASLDEFKQAMLHLTRVINRYDHCNYPIKINELSMIAKLNQLEQSLLNADRTLATPSSSDPEKKSRGSGMVRFFHRRLSFRGEAHAASSSTPSQKH